MFTICKEIIEQNRLEEELEKSAQAEANFTAEIGVMDRTVSRGRKVGDQRVQARTGVS